MGQKILIRTDKNGTKYWGDYTCDRCGGVGGSDAWEYTGWTCYKCGGTGRMKKPDIWKEYTPEYEAKLNERRAKREAKKQAEHEARLPEIRKEWLEENNFNADGQTFLFLGNTYEAKERIKECGGKWDSIIGWHIAAPVDGFQFLMVTIEEVADENYWGYAISQDKCKNIENRRKEEYNKQNKIEEKTSEWVGEVKQRITVNVTYIGSASWEQPAYLSWEPDVLMYLHKFVDVDGNMFVWKTTSGISIDENTTVELTGTIKEHKEYKETKQTVLTRCKIA